MTLPTVAQFRSDFPAFADATIYPDSSYTFWSGVAAQFVDSQRWGGLYPAGIELYVAHQLVLEARSAGEAANGTPAGGQVGPINTQSVDKTSVGFDTASAIETDAGHWNLTTYGTRFIRMARMIGCAGLQFGQGEVPPLSSAEAWIGPDPYPSQTGFN